MGTIVCQACNSTIDHFEDEKVTVLYSKSKCKCCDGEHLPLSEQK
ncbi:GapA-binding peptide SR1P [Bacillus sp. FJAT-29790]|nr:GapA-binding peptide SR1P [Bacillus sp. FJAT-29790]MBU8877660.1 GapA-binding peptide SR1P [Bacillus sp. FJAT-29790]